MRFVSFQGGRFLTSAERVISISAREGQEVEQDRSMCCDLKQRASRGVGQPPVWAGIKGKPAVANCNETVERNAIRLEMPLARPQLRAFLQSLTREAQRGRG
jgi:hypothetical protein